MGEFIGLIIGTVIVVLIFLGMNQLFKETCYVRWQSFNPQYSVLAGCMIEYNGKMIPADNYRTNDINLD